MKRNDFLGIFLGFIIQRTPKWLPEEATEEEMLNVMQKRIVDHNQEIRKVLIRNNGEGGL